MEAEEAKEIGLINFIVERPDIEAATVAYAKTIADNAPLTVKAAKAALNTWERGAQKEEVELVRDLVKACFDSDDYKEGRRAFKEKRTPDFVGR
jgi:1,4-dihydroxy-2-naphthoyl-CoA synthase